MSIICWILHKEKQLNAQQQIPFKIMSHLCIMPLKLKQNIKPNGLIGIWSIEEDEGFFLEKLGELEEESKKLEKLKGRRRTEWLSSRYLVHFLSGREKRGKLIKDEFGKPFLEDSDHFISISHSGNMSAVVASKNKVGIDIQKHVERITRIAHKFVNEDERLFLNEDKAYIPSLHIIWGAKESLYKAYGRQKIDFRKHLKIKPFVFNKLEPVHFEAELIKDDLYEKYKMTAKFIDNFYLVYAVQL